jgi:hypothetical protein
MIVIRRGVTSVRAQCSATEADRAQRRDLAACTKSTNVILVHFKYVPPKCTKMPLPQPGEPAFAVYRKCPVGSIATDAGMDPVAVKVPPVNAPACRAWEATEKG